MEMKITNKNFEKEVLRGLVRTLQNAFSGAA